MVIVGGKSGVPPSGGSLEIGNGTDSAFHTAWSFSSPFGGIPRNWKLVKGPGVSTESGSCSPFGGIPRNWKHEQRVLASGQHRVTGVPPSGGSLEIGNNENIGGKGGVDSLLRSPFGGIPRNWKLPDSGRACSGDGKPVPPSGGSLEIGNGSLGWGWSGRGRCVPPSGGSLEIGNCAGGLGLCCGRVFPLRGDP